MRESHEGLVHFPDFIIQPRGGILLSSALEGHHFYQEFFGFLSDAKGIDPAQVLAMELLGNCIFILLDGHPTADAVHVVEEGLPLLGRQLMEEMSPREEGIGFGFMSQIEVDLRTHLLEFVV